MNSMALVSTLLFSCMAVLPASAEPPQKSDEHVQFGTPVVLCDTDQQVLAIYNADQKDPHHGAYSSFLAYYSAINGRGEHVCMAAPFKVAHITGVTDLGKFYGGSDKNYHAWMIQAGNEHGDGYLLYVERDGKQDWQSMEKPQGSSYERRI